jgi:hypothetical protein
MNPKSWVKNLLERHDLPIPDGRPLYQYRVTDSEYLELTKTLKTSTILGVNNITHMLYWDAAFVIYGAEWWRRNYSGEWGWAGIFNSVGIADDELNALTRSDLIKTGLQRWRREVRKNNQGIRQFLGTVATEGGLPLNQLSETGGWLHHLLKPVIRKHVSRNVPVDVLLESYKDIIPKSYSSAEMLGVLSDIISAIVHLKSQFSLAKKESPLQWLDENEPSWRERFPLPIEDGPGRSLLSDLVNTASKVHRDPQNKNPIRVERLLLRAESMSPEFITQLEMPEFVFGEGIGLDLEQKEFIGCLSIEVVEPNGSEWPWCKAFITTYKGKKALKVSAKTLKLTDKNAVKELTLRIKSVGVVVHEFPLVNGCHLDTELPWLFKEIDNQWHLHGVASQSVKEEFALLYMPDKFSYTKEDENTHSEYGTILKGKLIKISGAIQCHYKDQQFKLSAGVQESLIHYRLKGERFPHKSSPSEIFIGIPDLIETNLITDSSTISRGRLLAKPVAVDAKWLPISQVGSGYFEVRLFDSEGSIKFCRRIGLLDEDFSYKLKPDSTQACKGSICLSGVGNAKIYSDNTNLRSVIVKSNKGVDITFEVEGSPPLTSCITLLPLGAMRELSLNFPYPSTGALLFDANGKEVVLPTDLYLNNLAGYRIKIFDHNFHQSRQADLTFSLIDKSMSQRVLKDIYIRRMINLKSEVSEFSVCEWKPIIDSLINVSPSLDASVNVSMFAHGQKLFDLDVCRYINEINPYWEHGDIELDSKVLGDIDVDELHDIHISALNFNQPEQADITLDAKYSEGVSMGTWSFHPEKRKPGPWLIYPLENSKVQFRPLLWNVTNLGDSNQENSLKINSLPRAISIENQFSRNEGIFHVLGLMAEDANHKSWEYLTHLWVKCRHLPLSTFDVWKVAANTPSFLACLLIRNNDDIIVKLENEFPIVWELVTLSDWKNALQLYQNKISGSLTDDVELVNSLLLKKINLIEKLGPSLISMAQILKFDILGTASPGLAAMKIPVQDFLQPQLTALTQSLLQNHAESSWPVFLSSIVTTKTQSLPSFYVDFLTSHHIFQRPIIYLPLLLAWQAFSDEQDNWAMNSSELFKIKQLIQFDQDWFEAVFQLLLGWLSQQNTIGEKNHDC